MMLKTNMATPVLLASLLASCQGGDTALDEPGTITQMGSSANVLIKNSVSKQGADVGGSVDTYQRGVALPGDVDGDGLGDLLVGATITWGTDPRSMVSHDPATNTGHTYLVRGAALKRTLGR